MKRSNIEMENFLISLLFLVLFISALAATAAGFVCFSSPFHCAHTWISPHFQHKKKKAKEVSLYAKMKTFSFFEDNGVRLV
jgi:hypothetical protein